MYYLICILSISKTPVQMTKEQGPLSEKMNVPPGFQSAYFSSQLPLSPATVKLQGWGTDGRSETHHCQAGYQASSSIRSVGGLQGRKARSAMHRHQSLTVPAPKRILRNCLLIARRSYIVHSRFPEQSCGVQVLRKDYTVRGSLARAKDERSSIIEMKQN